MYRRELTGGRTEATLQLGPSADGLFVIDGLALARDNFVNRGGLTLQTDMVAFSLAYEMRRARNQLRHAVQLSFGY